MVSESSNSIFQRDYAAVLATRLGEPRRFRHAGCTTRWHRPPPPEWLARVNALGELMDARGIVPLDERSLMDAARRHTGLDDFGDSEWKPHFRCLSRALEEEARLNFFGRVLTRSERLSFDAVCLDYHQNVRSVRTASSEQVRQPIYREGLEQWRHYEPWLGELKEKLGDAVVRYRHPPPG
jgi:hypothetical protein